MTESKEKGFEGWAILELMGHRRLAGAVSEALIAGAPFVRIDVPTSPPMTQFYSAGAIYCLTPSTEELVRQFVSASDAPGPVARWELRPALVPASGAQMDDDEFPAGG